MENKEVKVIKNTLFMFLRMLFVMFLTLFTTRLLLKTLGFEEYGIYDLVFGIVLMFNVVGGAMATTLQRFYNISLENSIEVSNIYNVSLQLFLMISLIVFSLGFLFSNNIISWLKIPVEYQENSVIFFRLCILNLVFLIWRIPYIALLISYEKMGIYSFISVGDAIFKFIGVFILSNFVFNKGRLVSYGIIMCLVSMFITMVYIFICYQKIKIPKINLKLNRNICKEVLSFSGWTLFGSTASLYSQQGISILLNKFFGILVNAANAITQQVYNAVFQFVNSFQVAFNPYLMKVYAGGNGKVNDLVIVFTKVSIFLYMLVAIPLAIFLNSVLVLWLGGVPEYSYIFIQLLFLAMVFEVISTPLWIIIQSSGEIKKYQIIISIILICNIPLAWYLVKYFDHPALVYISKFFITILAFAYRLMKIKKLTNINMVEYFRQIVIPLCLLIFCVFPPILYFENIRFEFNELLLYVLGIMLVYVFVYYFLFLTSSDREKIMKYSNMWKGKL